MLEGGYDVAEMHEGGYTAEEMKEGGVEADALHEGGFVHRGCGNLGLADLADRVS